MERREVLKKAMRAIPMFVIYHGAGDVGRAAEINPNSKYLVLVNPRSIDVDDFCSHPSLPFPAGTPIFVVHDSDMDNAIRILELKE